MSSLRGYYVPVVMRVTEVRTVMVDLGELDDYGMPPWVPGEPIDMDSLDGFGELWAEGAECIDTEEATAKFAEYIGTAHPYYVPQGPREECPHCGTFTDPNMYRTVTWHAPMCVHPSPFPWHPTYPGPPAGYRPPPTKEGIIMSPADHEGGGESGQAARFTAAVDKDGTYSKDDKAWQDAVDKGMDGPAK